MVEVTSETLVQTVVTIKVDEEEARWLETAMREKAKDQTFHRRARDLFAALESKLGGV